jgi:uncharacterized membrane protein YgaE (UPF0421/DUF939 family)
MKLGARTIKTGIAITLAIYLAALFNLGSVTIAAIAATFAIQPSIYRSYQTILEQVQANIIGAFFAILFFISVGNDPFIIGLVVVIVIAINLKLKIESTIPLAIVTVIVLMESPGGDFIFFAIDRFLLILLGVFSSFLVNLFFMPPRYETKLYYKVLSTTEDILKWMRLITRHASEYTVLKEDLMTLREQIIKTNQYYLFYKEERNYIRQKQFPKGRKLVLYRQMIATTTKALETLKSLHRHENELSQAPDNLQKLVRDQIDCLTNYHERILLKYNGKLRSQPIQSTVDELCYAKHFLTDEFLAYYKQEEVNVRLFPVIALIIDYSEQLEHLNKLIESFQTYHKEQNEVKISEKEIVD